MFDGFAFALTAGAGTQNRTADLLITNQSLYQLSYSGAGGAKLNVQQVFLNNEIHAAGVLSLQTFDAFQY